MITCRVCGNSSVSAQLIAREVMYGDGGEFEYAECSRCGCLQITEVPADLSPYYPADYYSFNAPAEEGRFKQFFIRSRARHAAGRKNPVGWLYGRMMPAPPAPAWLSDAEVGYEDEILDVGCGAGAQLLQLSYAGFSRLTGIDPLIAHDRRYRVGVSILRRTLAEMTATFDLIMLHHSLEHMPDQVGTLEHLYRLLKPAGQVLLRTPLAGSLAWQRYGVDWSQLDAPRHLHLHTERSMKFLATQTGFRIERTVYDSTGFQFWGSEQIRRGVPLVDRATGRVEPKAGLFTDAELKAFEDEASRLNETGEGDQACFYLRKI